MAVSNQIKKKLESLFYHKNINRPLRVRHYEAGRELYYDLRLISGSRKEREINGKFVVEKFVGGGFAGQVYKVKLVEILEGEKGLSNYEGLHIGNSYAIKILVPPSRFSLFFRNLLFAIGFQAPFQLQVNPFAARAGALWQKFIRRACKLEFGSSDSVVDIYATFIDDYFGSCGEVSEWIEGRTWKLESDEFFDLLTSWEKGRHVDPEKLGSQEYRAKKEFMKSFVELLHKIGAYEFARQYEWSTWKSQPNCLKRTFFENDPVKGLVAVDFRAGLTLLPFLPMSPGDFKLIYKGILRGSWVQFDRGNIEKLDDYVNLHKKEFKDMDNLLEELKESEKYYRNSMPDIFHNHISFIYDLDKRKIIYHSTIDGWRIRNFIDSKFEKELKNSNLLFVLFCFLGFFPFIGTFLRRALGHKDWYQHYRSCFTNLNYFIRTIKAKVVEKVIDWHESGRVNDKQALAITDRFWPFLYHLPFSYLPLSFHRSFTDYEYLKNTLYNLLIRPFQLYFNAELREEWLFQMIVDGKKHSLVSEEDAEIILSQIKEPFIQKYLKALAVHVCTLPVTQVVSVMVAVVYILLNPQLPQAQAWAIGIGIVAAFQVVPVSPGSLVRGLYVLFLALKEKDFKNYNIAICLGFFKYVGYLAFPIQMAHRYPVLARFMACNWACKAVHVVPVFGERGALLEHKIFSLFYNWPLTIRRKFHEMSELRKAIGPRYWHVFLLVAMISLFFTFVDYNYFIKYGSIPYAKDIWMFFIMLPVLGGTFITLLARGASFSHRVLSATIAGPVIAIINFLTVYYLIGEKMEKLNLLAQTSLWKAFTFSLISVITVLFVEFQFLTLKRKT